MKSRLNKFWALMLALLLCIGGFSSIGNANAAVINDNTEAVVTASGQQTNIQDGVTLHCWNWSYKNIEANMALIASMGYTSIQTSPIQQSKEGTSTYSMDSWWLLYQPMNFNIDNSGKSGLGTKAEFISMCNTAHQYGIKVIVDVVANHLGNQTGNDLSTKIQADIRNDTSYWHDYTKNTQNYNSRYEVTQFCMNGLPDLNTSDSDVQNDVIGFLKECIDAGADGFRFDAAKHIEVPTDNDSCASDFWPNVINAATSYAQGKDKTLYCYGELLDSPGGTTPSSAYTPYMSITDNSWGNQLRENISSGHTSAYNYVYHKGNDVLADKLVLWAESHDTYAGGESKNVSQQSISKTWALVAARADAMGLYFARPTSTNLNNTPMGTASVTGWANSEVAAVNKFHNAFVGQSEYVSNEGSISYCERGTSGVVLVNCSDTSTSVSVTAHTMAAGTYKDQITGNTFTVANGKITGNIGGTGIAVVYNVSESSTTPATKNIAYIELPSSWGSSVYCYAYNDSDKNNGEFPGVLMTKVSGRLYKYEVPSNITNPKVIFYSSNTNRYPADMEPGLSLYGSMLYKNGQWTSYNDGSTTPTNPAPTPTTSASQEDKPNPTTSNGSVKPNPTTSGKDNSSTPTTSSGSNVKPNPTTSNNVVKPDPTTTDKNNTKPDPTTSNNIVKPDPTTADKNNTKPDPTTSGNIVKPDPTTVDKDNGKPNSTTVDKDNEKPDSTTTDKDNEKPDSTTADKNNDKTDSTTADKNATTADKNDPDTDPTFEEDPDGTVEDDENQPTKDDSSESLPEETQPGEVEKETTPHNGTSDNNNGSSGKKFPWPAVVIPVVLLGAGAGIYVFIKKKQ